MRFPAAPCLVLVVLVVAAPGTSRAYAQTVAEQTAPVPAEPGFASRTDSPEILAERLNRILDDPALTRAHIGLTVQVAETGEVLFERSGERRFTPASNTKLVTGAVALDVLGPDYTWTTRLLADGRLAGNTLDGDLWIVGGGDPSLSRATLGDWARRLKAAGIEKIAGSVIADDRIFPQPQWGVGWMWDDLYSGWSSGVSGLQLSPNTVRAALVPGSEIGAATRLVLREKSPDMPIANLVRTGAPGSDVRLQFVPPPEGGTVELHGWIPLGEDSTRLYLATPHPTLYLLDWVALVFAEHGLEVEGEFRRASRNEQPGDPSWKAESVSVPLARLLGDMLKPSDNQMAETMLRTIAVAEGLEGTGTRGLEVVGSTLAGWGIEPGAVDLSDGSGLSRYNEVTPNALARMLRSMWRHADYRTFLAALPIAGKDGTMRRRLIATPGFDNVRAKTGSLSAVRALSGYLQDGSGETLVFSLILNGYDSPGAVAVALEDLIIEQIALYRRPVEAGWPKLRAIP